MSAGSESSSAGAVDCPNCSAVLNGRYCSECGQRNVALDPPLRTLLHDLLEDVLNVDGRIFQTARLLLTRPGALSLEHLDGRRARYLSPIRIYLLLSLAYFAIAAVAPQSGFQVQCSSCSPEQRALVEQHAHDALVLWVPRIMFALVPLFAGLVALVARRSGRHYPQHLYFAMHVHAAWFLFAAAGTLGGFALSNLPRTAWQRQSVSLIVITCAACYLLLAMRRTYRLPRWSAIWRTAVIGWSYLLISLLAVAAIAIPVILRDLKSTP